MNFINKFLITLVFCYAHNSLSAQNPKSWPHIFNNKLFLGNVKMVSEKSTSLFLEDNYSITYLYNKINQAIELVDSISNSKYYFTYNEKGNITEITLVDSAMSVWRTIYKYNGLIGTVEKINKYDQNDKQYLKLNKKGKIIEIKSIDLIGRSEGTLAYKYDSKSNLVKENYDDIRGKGTIEYIYDSNNHKIQEIYESYTWKSKATIEFAYNTLNDIREEICYLEDGTIDWTKKYSYGKFDSKGNWTYCTCVKTNRKGEVEYITNIDRKISYY